MQHIDLQKELALYQQAKGDKALFSEIYNYFLNDVYRFAYSLLGNQHDAEDVTSQTFIEFYKKFENYEWKNISMKFWLFKTCKYFAFNKNRSLQKSENLENQDLIADEVEISFVDEIIQADLIEKIRQEIEKLEPMEKNIINLRLWEGLSFVEIGEIIDLSEDASRMRFNRAISKLREAVQSKGLKSLFALPFLMTYLLKAGEAKAYSAPVSLATASIGSLATNTATMLTMSTIKTFLVSKAGIAVIGLVTITTITAGGFVGYHEYSKFREKDKTAEVTPTPTITSTPTVIPTSLNDEVSTYTDNYISFDYPKGYKVVVKDGFIEKDNDGNIINFTGVYSIEISSPDGKFLFSQQHTASAGDNGQDWIAENNINSYNQWTLGGWKPINLVSTPKIYTINENFSLMQINSPELNFSSSPALFYKKDRNFVNVGFLLDEEKPVGLHKVVQNEVFPYFHGKSSSEDLWLTSASYLTIKCGDQRDSEMEICKKMIGNFINTVKQPTTVVLPSSGVGPGYKLTMNLKPGEVVNKVLVNGINGIEITNSSKSFSLKFAAEFEAFSTEFSKYVSIGKTSFSDNLYRAQVSYSWVYVNEVITEKGKCGNLPYSGDPALPPCGTTVLIKSSSPNQFDYFFIAQVDTSTQEGLDRADAIMKSITKIEKI